MIRQFLLTLLLLLTPILAAAQQTTGEISIVTPDTNNDANWESLAQRAEIMAERGNASRFAITRLRVELVVWRDTFLTRMSENRGRLVTVDAQIAALGERPESGEESELIATKRAVLTAQRDTLAAPGILAHEAWARANGLISEFDTLVRLRQTQELTKRGSTPLNPANWLVSVLTVWESVYVVSIEIAVGVRQQYNSGQLITNLPRALLFLTVALTLLVYARRGITDWRTQTAQNAGRWLPLWLMALSLAQITVSLLGLFALTVGLDTLNIFGLRGNEIIGDLPFAGFFVIFSWWLCRHVFPVDEMPDPLGYDNETRASGRRYGLAIAWVLAIGSVCNAVIDTLDVDETTVATLEWPIITLLGILLWRLGNLIKRVPEQIDDAVVSVGRVRSLIGRTCIVVAVVSPVMAAIGYSGAGRSFLLPTIISLAVIGFLLIVQRLVQSLSRPIIGEDDQKGVTALLPIFVNFGLYILSVPLFALIWGAGTDDLLEVWTRFREGFSIGESQISPTDFLMFAIVFVLGYLLTRLIQGALRKTVFPRTRLDLGGQNAIIAGFGYVGIILASIAAITSAGIDLSNLAIVAGALSVGIGFGLQNIVSNFVSGIILLIERPVSEGDWIEVGGQMGYVRAISVRSTRIETFDRTDVIIPNADLVSGQVTNWTRGNMVGRVIVPVGVAYGSDVDQVQKILQDIAEAHPMVLMAPPPSVLFMAFGADSLDFEIRAILRDVNYVLNTKSEINYEIAAKFAAAGIEIPFAQRDLWLRNPDALKDAIS